MTIHEMIRAQMRAMRDDQNEVALRVAGGLHECKELLVQTGVQILRSGFDSWCHSDTCNHNSHDPGQDWTEILLPTSWVDAARGASHEEWDMWEEDCPMALIPIPSTEMRLLVERSNGRHFASWTTLVSLRPEAQAALAATAVPPQDDR